MVNKSTVYQAINVFILILLSGCVEKLDFARMKGAYSGTFNYFRIEASNPPEIASVNVNLTQNAYNCSSGENYIPAGGEGVFTVFDGQKIKFEDQKFRTANFDWGLILNGEYKYRLKGDSLILTKGSAAQNLYKYRLKRIE